MVMPGGRQRVVVEEALAIQRYAAERTIKEAALHHIGVVAIGIELQHAMTPKHHRNRSAGLGIGSLVRQVVGVGKAFVAGGRTNPTGQIHTLIDDAVPQTFARLQQGFVTGFVGDVGHRAI